MGTYYYRGAETEVRPRMTVNIFVWVLACFLMSFVNSTVRTSMGTYYYRVNNVSPPQNDSKHLFVWVLAWFSDVFCEQHRAHLNGDLLLPAPTM